MTVFMTFGATETPQEEPSLSITIDITADQTGPVLFDLSANGAFYTVAGDTAAPNIGATAAEYTSTETIAIFRNGDRLLKGNGDREAEWVSATSFRYYGPVDNSPGAGVLPDRFEVLFK